MTPHQARLLERMAAEKLIPVPELRATCSGCDRLRAELAGANGALIAAREEARQMRIAADRLEMVVERKQAEHEQALRGYATTRQFHRQPAGEIEKRLERLENAYLVQQGRINTMGDKLDAIKGAL